MNNQQEEQEIGAAEAGKKFPSPKPTQAPVSLRKSLLFVFPSRPWGQSGVYPSKPSQRAGPGCALWLLLGSSFLAQGPSRKELLLPSSQNDGSERSECRV